MKCIKTIVLSLLLLAPSFAFSAVVFETNFDSIADWESQEGETGASPDTIGWGVTKALALQAPQGFSDYRAARGLLPVTQGVAVPPYVKGLSNFEVKPTYHRGASGKSLIANYEMANSWVGGHIGYYMGATGYDDIYIRWYKMFQSGWKYRTEQGGVIHKWFRLMSNVDDPAGVNSVDPTNMYLTPYGRPDWLHNCPVENQDNQCGKQAYFMLRDTQSTGRYGINEVSSYEIAYNEEGKAGTTQNDTYAYFDNNARFYWNDFHATEVTGTPGDFPWSMGNSSGKDFQGNGEWVCYEVHAKMNAIGQSDGLVELYINGVKVVQKSGLLLRNTAETKFNYLMIPDNMDNEIYAVKGNTTLNSNVITSLSSVSALGLQVGMSLQSVNGHFPAGTTITGIDDVAHTITASQNATKTNPDTFHAGLKPPPNGEQSFAIDDLVISTTYIGPDYVIGGGSPPATYTGKHSTGNGKHAIGTMTIK